MKKLSLILTKDILENDYKELGNIKDVAAKYNVHRNIVKKYLDKFEIEKIPYRKYKLNEDIFYKDNEISFYLAGFIAADGCLSAEKYDIAIRIREKDVEHITKIKDLFGDEKRKLVKTVNKDSERNPKWNNSILLGFHIQSKILYNGLTRFGLEPRKSQTLEFENWLINNPLVNHFIRGYFDGDGSICVNNFGQKQIHIRGTEQFLRTIHNIFILNCNLSLDPKSIKEDSGIFSLQYNGNGISKKIGEYLYKYSTIYMNRKYNIFQL